MRKLLLSLIAALALMGPARAVDSTVTALTAASAFGGGELLYIVQSAADRKGTPAQMATYVYGLMTGDCTITASVITCTKINGVTFPASGTSGGIPYFSAAGAISSSAALTANLPVIGGGAGVAPSVGTRSGNTTGFATFTGTVTGGTNCAQWDTNGNLTAAGASCGTATVPVGSITGLGTGVATWLATPSSANLAAAITDETGTGAAVFGTSPTFSTGVTFGFITGSTQCLHVNTSGVLSGTGADCGAGGGGVTSIAGNSGAFTLNATSGITNSTNDIVCTAGSSTQFGCVKVDNTSITAAAGIISTAAVTTTPSTQTGTNYAFQSTDRSKVIYLSNASAQTPTIAAATGSFGSGWFVTACNIAAGIQTITPASGTIGGASTYVLNSGSVASPVCINIISDGTNYVLVPSGNSYTIASGTSALGTGAITSATCATAVTTSAPNTATGDVVWWGFNGDPTAVTGYVPLVAGMLTIVSYPSAGNVNFKVCNNTSGSITPGAITLNWRVIR